jgi:hypothetical protein
MLCLLCMCVWVSGVLLCVVCAVCGCGCGLCLRKEGGWVGGLLCVCGKIGGLTCSAGEVDVSGQAHLIYLVCMRLCVALPVLAFVSLSALMMGCKLVC